MNLELVITLTASILTALGAGLSVQELIGRIIQGWVGQAPKDVLSDESDEGPLTRHLNTRIREVRDAINRFQREKQITRWSNGLLVTGQYVVGGTLASSFIQQSISSTVVGVLGLIVLVATIVHQRYRPDVRSRVAHTKVALLKSTLRRVEDDLVVSDTPDEAKIIRRLTRILNEVDRIEEWEADEDEDSDLFTPNIDELLE